MLNLHIMNAVHHNLKILDYDSNWSQLCFLEAFYIKTLKPKINAGLKASKELQPFQITVVLRTFNILTLIVT